MTNEVTIADPKASCIFPFNEGLLIISHHVGDEAFCPGHHHLG